MTLYRLYSHSGVLLYVGISQDARKRLTQHRRDKWWWPLVAWVKLEDFATPPDAARAEQRAIVNDWPLCNRAGHPEANWVRACVLEPELVNLAEAIYRYSGDIVHHLAEIKDLVGPYRGRRFRPVPGGYQSFLVRAGDRWLFTDEAYEATLRGLEFCLDHSVRVA